MKRPLIASSATSGATIEGRMSSAGPAITTIGVDRPSSESHVECLPPLSNVSASVSGSHFSRTRSPSWRNPWRTYASRASGSNADIGGFDA